MAMRAGDLVEVRSKEEILRSVDKMGRLDGLPLMPQMLQYCGQRFTVYKRAHKTCDTVKFSGGRRLQDCVHLDLRCDGKAFGGCQAACLIFWKEAWLKPANEIASDEVSRRNAERSGKAEGTGVCSVENLLKATRPEGEGADQYACQATLLLEYTTALHPFDVRQYVEDYTSGNTTLGQLLRGFIYLAYYHLTQAWRNKLGRPSRWLYDRFQQLRGGIPFPRRKGTLPDGQTPTCSLNLQPGELVRVKSYPEILATLDGGNKNRGLLFDAEMVPFCGDTYRVKTRIDKFLNERTGRMSSLKTPAVMLENVWCQARYSNCRMFCPRSIYPWWREAWLERAADSDRGCETITHE